MSLISDLIELLTLDLLVPEIYLLVMDNIRIFHECEVRIEKSVRGSLLGITRLCRVMPNSDPEGQSFLSEPNNHERFFSLHTLSSPAFDFIVEVAINESRVKFLCFYVCHIES